MGLGVRTRLRGILERQCNRRYAAGLAAAKRRIGYEDWLKLMEGQKAQGEEPPYAPGVWDSGRFPSLEEAYGAAWGPGLSLLRKKGIRLILQREGYVDPQAFERIASYFEGHPETLVLYGDEDALDGTGGHRCRPCYRPDWSPDTWLSCCYLGSLIAVREELARELAPGSWPGEEEGAVFFRDPAEVRELVSGLLELAGGFRAGCTAVRRLPGMLFHLRPEAAGDVQAAYGRQRQEAAEAWEVLSRERIKASSARAALVGWQGQDGSGRTVQPGKKIYVTSVIIPSRDNPDVLAQCLHSLQKCCGAASGTEAGAGERGTGACRRLEIVVVDNGSSPENRARIEKITHGMKYIYEPMPFNFSRMCNRGAREASGELLLFLNDDITVCADGWLEAMAERALRPYVGAVGLKLYYPDSVRIQHAGIANLPGGPMHKLQFTRDGEEEDHGYGTLDRNVVAVTGACLMVERERFWQAGGFPEDLPVAYNDVELCFRLREAGLHNVVLNRFHAFHHESLSRGNDLTREKMERLGREKQLLYQRHPFYLDYDPYYPRPLCMELGDTHIYDTYLDTRSDGQKINGFHRQAQCPEQEPDNLQCALEAALAAEGGTGRETLCLQGYVVVKWENNACYKRLLLLRRQEGGQIYTAVLRDKYSGQAEYGMQEQPNVALCGFKVLLRRGVLPAGRYKVGFQARSRMGRRRLTRWTGEELSL